MTSSTVSGIFLPKVSGSSQMHKMPANKAVVPKMIDGSDAETSAYKLEKV